MTLNQKFQDVEVMFEGQEGSLGYDEFCEAPNKCEQIAEEFAVKFAKWLREKTAHTKGGGYKLYNDFQQYNINELLQIFKHSHEADA